MTHGIGPGGLVVVLNGSHTDEYAIGWAAEQSEIEQRRLFVVVHGDDTARNQIALDEAVSTAKAAHPALDVVPMDAGSDPRRLLVELSERSALLVLGSRGGGNLRSSFLGSVAGVVGAQGSCPVMVARVRRPQDRARGVLVGADGTPESRPVLEFAFDQAALRAVPLVVSHRLWDVVATVTQTRAAATEPTPGELAKRELLLTDSVAHLARVYPDVDVRIQEPTGFAEDIAVNGAGGWELLVVPRHAVGAPDVLPTATLATTLLEYGPTSVALVPEASSVFV